MSKVYVAYVFDWYHSWDHLDRANTNLLAVFKSYDKAVKALDAIRIPVWASAEDYWPKEMLELASKCYQVNPPVAWYASRELAMGSYAKIKRPVESVASYQPEKDAPMDFLMREHEYGQRISDCPYEPVYLEEVEVGQITKAKRKLLLG